MRAILARFLITLSATGVLAWAIAAHGSALTPGDQRLSDLAREDIAALLARPIDPHTIAVAGDSHAGGIAAGTLCGSIPVNAGVGGITTGLYRDAWIASQTIGSGRYRAIVLEIGTNDLQSKRRPADHNAENEEAAADLLTELQRRTQRLIVLAIPPNHHPKVESSEVRRRNEVLRAQCARLGCEILDPFAASRDVDGQTMRAGFSSDGVHYDDYQPIRARIEMTLCKDKN